jgi:hypothetical protein
MKFADIQIGYEFEFCSQIHQPEMPKKLKDDLNLKFIGRTKSQWRLAWDSSIKSYGDGYSHHELISPPLPYTESMTTLDRIFTWMEKNHCQTNSSTGLHVSINFIDHEKNKKIDPIKLILFIPDGKILLQYKRQRNPWCKSYTEDLKKWAKSFKNEGVKNWLHALKVFNRRLRASVDTKNRILSYRSNRKNIYVEFRMIGNKNYHRRGIEIKSTIDELIEYIYISANNHLFETEYHQMLMQYIR